MRGIKLKTVLLIILICILAGMVMALSNPNVISVGLRVLYPEKPTEAATAAPASLSPASSVPTAAKATLARLATISETVLATATVNPYFSNVETIYTSPTKDQWTYQSPSLYIDVHKISEKKPVLRIYFVAEIRTTDPSLLVSSFAGVKANAKDTLLPEQIAQKNKAVLAVASDCSLNRYKKGIIIRSGLPLSYKMAADTLALLPDGSFKIYSPKETKPAALITMGVKNTFSYGPTLIRDGVVNASLAKDKLFPRCARTGVGMVEPGHYIFIVVDCADKNYSMGASLTEFAAMFRKYKCTQAYNLDGGPWAAMCFMGKQLNGKPGAPVRKVPDLLSVGTSELVGVK